MKLFAPILFLICFTISSVSGQTDGAKEGFKISPIDSTAKATQLKNLKLSPVKGLTNKGIKPFINYTALPDAFKKKSGVDMTSKSTLVQPSWDIKQKFGEDQKEISKFSKDFYLGDLKTKSKTVVIKCRDHEYVDGDRIRLMHNSAIIHPNITLSGSYYSVQIDLNEGFNSIDFVALNEGTSRPNTAELKIYDEDGVLLSTNQWLITTGYKASLIIIREK
ncbi:MAG: hypothetical protein KC469_06960 [Flavobacteriaceae bacterium]|jgi:hypothetical protein|nr:hypothetical protein [Flavobacteriaceae bacterium]